MAGPQRPQAPGEITRLLHQASGGDSQAFDRIFSLVYRELRELARLKLRFERPGHTLNATALVHEAYLKLVGQTKVEWHGRQQLFAVASEAMRRILIDYAKRTRAGKRGAGRPNVPLDELEDEPAEGVMTDDQATDLIALDEALTRLAAFSPESARIVQLRFFGGLSNDEIAAMLDTSERSVRRSWTTAKAWLRREVGVTLGRDAPTLKPPPPS